MVSLSELEQLMAHIPKYRHKTVCPAGYYNRKGWHSVILQEVVDHKGWFIDVYIGWPGQVYDARVFANSSLYCSVLLS